MTEATYSKTQIISNQGMNVVEVKFEGAEVTFTLIKTGRVIFRTIWIFKPAEAYEMFRAHIRRNDKEAFMALRPDPRFCLAHEMPLPGYWDEKRGWLTYAENERAARNRRRNRR